LSAHSFTYQLMGVYSTKLGNQRITFRGIRKILTDICSAFGGIHKTLGDIRKTFGGIRKTFGGIRKTLADLRSTFAGVRKTPGDIRKTFRGTYNIEIMLNNELLELTEYINQIN